MYTTTTLDRLTESVGSTAGATRTPPVPRPGLPLEDVTEVLEHRPEAAGAARHAARQVLAAWHVGQETARAVVLAVSELVTNAVEHAEPPLALHLYLEHTGGRVWVGVTDGGPALHEGTWTASCADDEHGRGLAIVDMVAEARGMRTLPGGGATHWARLKSA